MKNKEKENISVELIDMLQRKEITDIDKRKIFSCAYNKLSKKIKGEINEN